MATYTVTDGQSQTFSFGSGFPNETAVINASGSSKISIAVNQGRNGSPLPVDAVLNLAPGAQVDAAFNGFGVNTITVNGDATTTVIDNGTNNLNVTGDLGGAPRLLIHPNVVGTGTFNLKDAALLEFGGSVASGIAVNLNPQYHATLKLDDPGAFKGVVNFNQGDVILSGLSQATDYDYTNGVLTIYGGSNDQALDTLRLVDNTANRTGLALSLTGSGVQVSEQGSMGTHSGSFLAGTPLTQHVAPPAAPQNVAVHDNTTGADLPDTSSAYTGPVVGVQNQFINITPDNLNITAKTDSLFIKTGSGNDAVAVRSGTNVVDCGAGSNFITGGSGFDTVFLDARNIPAAASAAGPVPGAIWDTIENFGPGDAATFWGIGTAAALSWQKDQGAVGHTGITLHANKQNGTEASLTLAGIDSKNGLSLSYGQSGGVDYLYVRAV